MNPSEQKQQQLLDYALGQLAPYEAVKGVVAVGSVAVGRARPGSDIDAVVFMEPLDLYLCPAEFVWRPSDNTYHSILADDPTLERDGIQLDLHRLDLAVWRTQDHEWPEPRRAELADGWIAYDPTGEIGRLIDERTVMPAEQRLMILDEVMTQTAFLIPDGDAADHWERLGQVEALDRLQTGYEELTRGLFAYHGQWRPWRSRSFRGLQRLNWLPTPFAVSPAMITAGGGHDFDSYAGRAAALRRALDELIGQLLRDGIYREDPDDEGFRRLYDEPGRAWNMAEWNAEHDTRR